MKQSRYDIVALVSNDLITDQRMQRALSSLSAAGYSCLLLGRLKSDSKALAAHWPFDQERLELKAESGKVFYLQLAKAHYQRLMQLKPRAILAVDLDTIAASVMAARKLGIPVIFDAHESFEDMPEVSRRWWIRAAWSMLGRQFVPHVAAAYTVGEDIGQLLSARYNMPFGVVRNFPTQASAENKRIFGLASAAGKPFQILYQGAVNEGRGLEELIQAASQRPDWHVTIVGKGPMLSELRVMANKYPAAHIEFTGERSPQELKSLTPKADLGYALMRSESLNYRLSLSNKSVDYLHARLPSLQMDWPEYRRIQDAYGPYCLVKDLSVEAILAAVDRCRDESLYMAMQKGCDLAAQDQHWQKEEDQLLSIWQSILPK